MTDADGAPNDTDSTVEQKARPDLSHVKQSCYPPRAPKKVSGCVNTASILPVNSQPKEETSESEGPPTLAVSSSDEEVSRVKVIDLDSDSDASTIGEGHSSQFLVFKKVRLVKPKSLPAAISKDLSEKEKT